VSRRLRLLIVTTDYPPAIGGIQHMTAQLARELAARHAVTVVAPAEPGAAAFDAGEPYRVVRCPAASAGPLRQALLLLVSARTALRVRPQVVLYCHIFAAVIGHALCRLLRLPYVVVAYESELHARWIQPFCPTTLRHSAGCIGISARTAEVLTRAGCHPAAITVVGTGVDASMLTSAVALQRTPPLVSARRGPLILTLSRLDERYKGHDVMLQALPLIAAVLPDVTYVIAGDGRYRGYYQRLAEALGVDDHVVFTGVVDQAERLALYDRCDLFAMISREGPDGSAEGFGIVFLEAAARGRPAVGGRSGGVLDAIVDDVTGVLVEPTDVGAVADACLRLLGDPHMAGRLGQAGQERVRQEYTWEHVARRVEGVLARAVMAQGRGQV